MSITERQFIQAVQAAIDAPTKSGTKWDLLEKLFADNGLRGNGAINNSSGADRTTRVRQLATSKEHNGHTTREVASHSVFVLGGGTVATYHNDPSKYIAQFVQALKGEHPNFDTCLLMVASPSVSVSPVLLVKQSNQQTPIPYETWWPELQVTIMSTTTDGLSDAVDESPLYPGEAGSNVIFFGPPGTGKSTEVKKKVGSASMFRTQFHPEYSHADFIGSYRPVVGSETDTANQIVGHDGVHIPRPVNYFAFVPGPLALALECAFGGSEHVFLVIEEINRGDCAAIFGDAFQLLDRDDVGRSEFGITPRPELIAYFKQKSISYDIVVDGKLYLPHNLSLLATMNTSDQSLYPMDSAFKRRWQWVACPIDFEQLLAYTDGVRPFLDDGKTKWDWIKIVELINKNIVRDRMEDKQLGPWFIKPAKDGLVSWEAFLNKCLFYLWHDVFKDEQLSNLSPFKTDGPEVFGEVQTNIWDNGLAAGFKPECLTRIATEVGPVAAEGEQAAQPSQGQNQTEDADEHA
jgi:AAA domain (dynein-related subfamily)